MAQINYGVGAYRRDAGNIAELKLVNMFLEAVPEETGAVLLSREGLTLNTSPGDGPVTGIFRRDGVLGSDLFTLSGGVLYRLLVSIDDVVGDGPVVWAARAAELLVTAGGDLYSYNGTTLEAVTFPDSADVSSIKFHDGLFLATRSGSHRIYYSTVNDGRSFDGLDFFSAESSPDTLLDLDILGDTLWAFGTETVEPWVNTGDADAPYTRLEGRTFGKGIYATNCLVNMDNSILFVGSDGIVYRLADVPQRISDHGIEERIKASTEISAFGFVYFGHNNFAIRYNGGGTLPNGTIQLPGTHAYDVATGQWWELSTQERDNFRGQCATMDGDVAIFGDDEEGKTWVLSGYTEDGGTLTREFTAGFPLKGGAFTVDNVLIECNVGHTEYLAGEGSDPIAEMRASRDAGRTWGYWREAPLGQQGHYRTKTDWRRCGKFDWPGALFGIRCSEPIGFRISGVHVNEIGGGRSR